MLPHIKTPFKTAAITLVTALTLAVTSAAPAAAWGQREQDVLKGAAGALILKAIIDDAQRDRRDEASAAQRIVHVVTAIRRLNAD